MVLKSRIRILREKSGYTRKEVAALLGISYQTLAKYEQGNRTPDNEMLTKIASIYHVTTDYLLDHTYTYVPENFIEERGAHPYNLLQYALKEYFKRPFDLDDLEYIRLALDLRSQNISIDTFKAILELMNQTNKS